jgi:hypothetical protein
MLARSMEITLNGQFVSETPLLIPAFSSKVTPLIGEVIESLGEYLNNPILVSAFDVENNKSMTERLPITCSDLIFLDSGGYECSQDVDLADNIYTDSKTVPWKEWTPEKHADVVHKWPTNKSTVIVSYDHPNYRVSLEEQIDAAEKLFNGRKDIITEILLKPETDAQIHVQVPSILKNIEALRNFDIIGLTEKELGSTTLERLEKTATIRLALDDSRIYKPIHIFGSLDPIICPLFFISGADIFDGLTWLRYGFVDGLAVYEQNYGILSQPYDFLDARVRISRLISNLAVLRKSRQQMMNYLLDGDFKHFTDLQEPQKLLRPHCELFEEIYTALRSQLKRRGREV